MRGPRAAPSIARIEPKTVPASDAAKPRTTTVRRITPGDAPNAARTPISRVRDDVRQHRVHADRGDEETQPAKRREDRGAEAPGARLGIHPRLVRHNRRKGLIGVNVQQHAPDDGFRSRLISSAPGFVGMPGGTSPPTPIGQKNAMNAASRSPCRRKLAKPGKRTEIGKAELPGKCSTSFDSRRFAM